MGQGHCERRGLVLPFPSLQRKKEDWIGKSRHQQAEQSKSAPVGGHILDRGEQRPGLSPWEP